MNPLTLSQLRKSWSFACKTAKLSSFLTHILVFFGDEIFYEVLSSKGSVATKRKEHKVDDFEDLAWVYLDTPSWWIDKKDQQ